ncbi:CASC3/Barentsz eIF4AIII binding-domain-containing protein [Apodospora peruviana]|uniref:CASC3/Barentsz eIF4AIII binding-domain-containing protein n=1 Tax=Apodospora peruviana TaxID=516989 RepID=A0AAE0MBS8_9PEZI|nr:CASC3/Barentsz eIF4AIII binding-domain-containing protein [Apodospora peruviana]
MAHAAPRRRKIIGHRRRVDEAEDDGGPEALDLDDDSLTDGSMGSDENDAADDSDTSNVDETSPTSPNVHKKPVQNGAAKPGLRRQADTASKISPAAKHVQPTVTDTEIMLHGLSLADKDGTDTAEAINFDDQQDGSGSKETAPIVVSSSSVTGEQQATRMPVQEVKRREHEEYRRKRDEDPTFVPNRGAFFLHDHRHAGPAANGFRPFPRGARGRGRGAFAGPFAPVNHFQNSVPDPTTNAPWTHDMHEALADPPPHHHRPARQASNQEGPPNGNGIIPTAPPSKAAINREMSSEKHISNTTIRVYITPLMKTPKQFPGHQVKQYTKLPDHRPPLRRDKPVRISLPYHNSPVMPRYIFPANDRSFIFIPRAMRPNQKQVRGKGPRSVLGSMGGFSRRTSVWGGSFYGSAYSPSIAMSRRSSIAPDIGREFIISPTGSAISRPPLPMDNTRPVVRLPPQAHPQAAGMPMPSSTDAYGGSALSVGESSINDFPQPQTHPLPQKPTFQENRPTNIPMHQPRPQKTVSVENIESPVQAMNAPPQYQQQAFHQQVPPRMNAYTHESHARNPSYPSQLSSHTPLSQIPERAIHAAPFQPNTFAQPQGFYGQPYAMMQPQPQQGYYYPQTFVPGVPPNVTAPAFVPGPQPGQPVAYNQPPTQAEAPAGQAAGQQAGQGLIAQEKNGMVYYFDASSLPPMAGYASYPAAQPYAPGVVGMGAMIAPSPDTFYYQQQPAPGMVYYSQ